MTESDIELLKMAAKAAGMDACEDMPPQIDGLMIGKGDGDLWVWNPLEDDGDALRLSVKLWIHQTNGVTDAWATTAAINAIEPFGKDPYSATRRAITRAAAEIGKAMP